MSIREDCEAAIAGFTGELVTARIRLRALDPADVEPLFPRFDDWEVVKWLARPDWPLDHVRFEGFLASAAHNRLTGQDLRLAIVADGQPIGSISWNFAEAGLAQGEDGPFLGYWLGRAFWGKGYMTESVAAVADMIFARTSAAAIFSGLFAGNVGSLRVQEKVGFVVVGETMYPCRPQGADLPHINTELTRARRDEARR
jgi:RimJ/RimL family protein N-acetyltransferase